MAPTRRHGAAAARERLLADLARVRKRLGGARHDAIRGRLEAAAAAWHDPDAHDRWIAALLADYYDPLYRKALARAPRTVLARGDAGTLRAFLRARGDRGTVTPMPDVPLRLTRTVAKGGARRRSPPAPSPTCCGRSRSPPTPTCSSAATCSTTRPSGASHRTSR